jgi:hypothetical protein
MKFKSEYYNESQIDSIIFSYGFKQGRIQDKDKIKLNVNYITIDKMKLPISMNPMDFGKLSETVNIENRKLYILQNITGEIIMFSKFEEFNEVVYSKNGITLVKFKDEIISEDKFVRTIDNKKYYFENGKQILFTKEIKNKFIEKKKYLKIYKIIL